MNDRFEGSEESGRSEGNITNPTAKDRFLKLFVAKVNPEIVHEAALTNGVAKKKLLQKLLVR